MRVVEGGALREQLMALGGSSSRIDLAVAFWGEGAIEALALRSRVTTARIVCNLSMGGTNPRVIRELVALGARVKQSDTLHAKLYLFDEMAALGSSNASANGLSRQGDEVEGWIEANVVSTDHEFVRDAEALFLRIWEAARDVKEADLARAQEAWERRRRLGAQGGRVVAGTLLDALKTVPGALSDIRIFLKVDRSAMSDAGWAEIEAERRETGAGSELDGYEDWPTMPNAATLVCFHRGPRGGVAFDGFWHAPEERRSRRSADGTMVNLIQRVRAVQGLAQAGSNAAWKPVIERVIADAGDDEIICIEFGDLARRYISGAEVRGDA